jgi:hypothetical protein
MKFVKEVVSDLADLGVPFPNFTRYESARVSADFEFIRASIYLQGASFKDARDIRIGGVMTNVDHAERFEVTHSRVELTGEQREKAEDVCVRAFLDDLRVYCDTQPVVLLVDSFERCGERLRVWLRDHFLENYFFDVARRPAKLLLVVAGQTLPDFAGNWSVEDCERTLKLVDGLSRWTREHVEQCLKVHDFRYEEKDIDAFHKLIEMGIPPSQVVQMIESLVAQKAPKGFT